MKFTVPVPDLAAAVAWVNRAISTRPTQPALGGMLLELNDDTLRLGGTDLERTAETTIEVACAENGRVLVPGHIFTEVVRNLPASADGVQFTAGGGILTLDASRVTHELHLLDDADFPTREQPCLDQTVTLPGATLAAATAQVTPATTTELLTRPALGGVLFEVDTAQLTLAATDSYRLAVRELPCVWLDEPATALVPARALAEAARAMAGEDTVTVAVEARQVTFLGGVRQLTTRLIDGEFPAFRDLIPTGYQRSGTVDRQALLDALKQVSPYQATGTPVCLTFTPGRLDVDVREQAVGQGHAGVDADYQADTVTIAFNPAYLADGVAGVGDAKVAIDLLDGARPALIHAPEQDGYLYLLMPVRLP